MKLTPAARDALVCAAFDALHHYPADGWRDEPWFTRSPPFYSYAASKCPKLTNATGAGRALLRRGLLTPLEGPHHNRATLTEEGWRVFEEVATAEEKAVLVTIREDAEKSRLREAEDRRKREWHEEHAETLRAFNQRCGARGSRRNSIDWRFREIAYEIARGANNVDDLVAELRRLNVELEQIKADQEADEATIPKYEPEKTG